LGLSVDGSFEGKRDRLHQKLTVCFNRFKNCPLTINSQMFKAAILLAAEQLGLTKQDFVKLVINTRQTSESFCAQHLIAEPLDGYIVALDQIDKIQGDRKDFPDRLLVRGSVAIQAATLGFMPVLKGVDLCLAIIGRLGFDLERFSLSSEASVAMARLIDLYECLENYEALPFTLIQSTLSDVELKSYQNLARQVLA